MNLYLHGIDPGVDAASRRISDKRQDAASTEDCPTRSGVDSLTSDPGERFSLVMANPSFGKKSSIAIVNEAGTSLLRKSPTAYNSLAGQFQASGVPCKNEPVGSRKTHWREKNAEAYNALFKRP